MHYFATYRFWGSLCAAVLLLATGAAFAQQEGDPPGRVAVVTYREGSVVFAPQGDEEWVTLPQNRPLTLGDRLWTDAGARAEVQLGSATIHVNSESHLGIAALDERAAQFILMQGTVNARVREVTQGENFEIDTPNLAFRANQPGDYRIDISPDGGETRVVVESGLATVFGEGGQSINLGTGQQASFAGRYLGQVAGTPFRADGFSQWAAERNRAEDASASARNVPLGVVGYSQLDAYGSWSQDQQYGEVWYPAVAQSDWAPYRYGRWEWISPWGWTWIDDAPWGFAPFHYGRWTVIGNRWAWVPGRMVARPVYSPALVAFMGNGSSQGIGWYPLAPGEAWWPTYRASNRYVGFANFNINLNAYPRQYDNHQFRQRSWAQTSLREDDFRGGRGTRGRWQPVLPGSFSQPGVVPPRPERQRTSVQPGAAPRLQVTPPAGTGSGMPSRFWGGSRREPLVASPQQQQPAPAQQPHFVQSRPQHPVPLDQPGVVQTPQRFAQPATQQQVAPSHAAREQWQAQREQDRLQRDADRATRDQRQQAEAARRQQEQQNLLQRQQQDAARNQEVIRQQHEANMQRMDAQREALRRQMEEAGVLQRQQQQLQQRQQQQQQQARERLQQQQQRPERDADDQNNRGQGDGRGRNRG